MLYAIVAANDWQLGSIYTERCEQGIGLRKRFERWFGLPHPAEARTIAFAHQLNTHDVVPGLDGEGRA